MINLRTLLLGSLLTLAAVVPAPAAAGVDVEVAGRTATASIDLSGVTAEFILTFDRPQNLSPQNLGISAQLLSATDLVALATRLPQSSLLSVPTQLPLLITVEPPNGGLSMNNTVHVELHTDMIPYTAGSNFRLFKAPLGGQFYDITDEVAPGSVRTRGTTGGFSQFVVLLDLRPSADVVTDKFARLRARLADAPAGLASQLGSQLDAADAAWQAGNFSDAIAALDGFRADVSHHAGVDLANSWTPADRSHNVAGDLQSGATSLRFSLGYLRDFGL